MIGIFSRWQQLGRRYFWPHLLWGVVTASLGLPVARDVLADNGAQTHTNTLLVSNTTRLQQLIRLHDAGRRPALAADYWHQHAIRVVIRHLSFSLPAGSQQTRQSVLCFAAQCLAILHSLCAQLSALKPGSYPLNTTESVALCPVMFSIARWLSEACGIRADPAAN